MFDINLSYLKSEIIISVIQLTRNVIMFVLILFQVSFLDTLMFEFEMEARDAYLCKFGNGGILLWIVMLVLCCYSRDGLGTYTAITVITLALAH